MRLVVASNSAPRWHQRNGLEPRTPGGLVPLLAGLLAEYGGDWVCTVPPGDADRGGEPIRLPGGITVHQVYEKPDVLHEHYLTIGVRLMLWLFHYLFNVELEPVFDARFRRAFAAYERVNRAHAERLLKVCTGAADELLLINDYHLFLVPEMLHDAGTRRSGQMVYFHGLPWCEPQYFALLPAALRSRILSSLLRCDAVCFHDSRWARAFIACCERFLPSCRAGEYDVQYAGGKTRVVVAPFPLDVAVLDRMRTDERTLLWQERLAGPAAGRKVLARADRLDLWKNQPRGFAAYRALLEREPDLADEWWFCAVASAPTRGTERSAAYQQLCESLVNDINDTYGRPGRPAVSLVYPDLASTRNCVTAALSTASATLVNPILDGMNLVAKEALYLAERAPTLLSVNAGAYEQLAPYVLPVQPYDVLATADTLRSSMSGTAAITNQARRAALVATLTGPGPTGWLAQLTASDVPHLRRYP